MFLLVAAPLVGLIYFFIGVMCVLFLMDFWKGLRNSEEVRVAFMVFVIGVIVVISFMSIGT
jgi:hypothetical protein